jgi:hypothetical protein
MATARFLVGMLITKFRHQREKVVMRKPEAQRSAMNPETDSESIGLPASPKRTIISFRQTLACIGLKTLSQAPKLNLTALGAAIAISFVNTASIAQTAYAYTNQSDVTLEVTPQETFDSVISRAEVAARAEAQRRFDSNVLTSDVTVTVLGQNGRGIVPILVLAVSRDNWRNQPDTRRWATYFPTAKALLNLNNSDAIEQPASASSSVPPTVEPSPPVTRSSSTARSSSSQRPTIRSNPSRPTNSPSFSQPTLQPPPPPTPTSTR